MSTELALREAREIGEVFFKSAYFSDLKTSEQSLTKILAGQEFGLKPFQSLQGFDIIQGKPFLKPAVQMALLKCSGKYNYKVLTNTDKVCEIEFYEKINERWEILGTVSFTIEDAAKMNLSMKDNWKKQPKVMLFYRCISQGIRMFAPDIFIIPTYNEADEWTEQQNNNNINIDINKFKTAPPQRKVETAEFTIEDKEPEPIPENAEMKLNSKIMENLVPEIPLFKNNPAANEKIEAAFKEVKEENNAVITQAQRQLMWAVVKQQGITEDEIREWLKEKYCVGSTSSILKSDFDNIISEIKKINVIDKKQKSNIINGAGKEGCFDMLDEYLKVAHNINNIDETPKSKYQKIMEDITFGGVPAILESAKNKKVA